MKKCLCDNCGALFFGNGKISIHYNQRVLGLPAERTRVYEMCDVCLINFLEGFDKGRKDNIKKNLKKKVLTDKDNYSEINQVREAMEYEEANK